jgi:hypothetical protein
MTRIMGAVLIPVGPTPGRLMASSEVTGRLHLAYDRDIDDRMPRRVTTDAGIGTGIPGPRPHEQLGTRSAVEALLPSRTALAAVR